MARSTVRLANKILRVGIALAFSVAILPLVFGGLMPNKFGEPRYVIAGIIAGAFIGFFSFVAYSFLIQSWHSATEKNFTELRLRERMKELRCIYEVFDTCQKAHSVEEILKGLSQRICQAMLNPESCFVLIEYAEQRAGDYPPRREIKHEFVAAIKVFDSRKGEIRVAYTTDERIQPEERRFLDLVAGLIGHAIERGELLRESERGA